jgi:hypothetical protein
LPTPTPIVHRSCIHLALQLHGSISSSATHDLTSVSLPEHLSRHLDILAQPPNTLSISLPHDHTAHEHLNRPDALKRHLALASGLVQSESRAELVFRHSLGMINLVTKNDKGGVLELLHGEEGVELGFGFVQTLVILCVDEEDNAGDFRDCGERLSARAIAEVWRDECLQ